MHLRTMYHGLHLESLSLGTTAIDTGSGFSFWGHDLYSTSVCTWPRHLSGQVFYGITPTRSPKSTAANQLTHFQTTRNLGSSESG